MGCRVDEWDGVKCVEFCKLFGGDFDGQTIQIDTGRDFVKMAVIPKLNMVSLRDEEVAPSNATMEAIVYVRFRYICGDGYDRVGYVLENQLEELKMGLLG